MQATEKTKIQKREGECEVLRGHLTKLDPKFPTDESKKQELDEKVIAIEKVKAIANRNETAILMNGIDVGHVLKH